MATPGSIGTPDAGAFDPLLVELTQLRGVALGRWPLSLLPDAWSAFGFGVVEPEPLQLPYIRPVVGVVGVQADGSARSAVSSQIEYVTVDLEPVGQYSRQLIAWLCGLIGAGYLVRRVRGLFQSGGGGGAE